MIEPALSAAEWAKAKDDDAMDDIVVGQDVRAFVSAGDVGIALLAPGKASGIIVEPTKLLALLNDVLPDSDPKKITREWVDALRKEAERGRYAERVGDNAGYSAIDPHLADQIADSLEFYLPPE